MDSYDVRNLSDVYESIRLRCESIIGELKIIEDRKKQEEEERKMIESEERRLEKYKKIKEQLIQVYDFDRLSNLGRVGASQS